MKQLRSLFLLLLFALLSLAAGAQEKGGGEKLDIPEIVLEHLSDSYEWHIATFGGKSVSIPLPIIVRSSETGQWTFCTAGSLPHNFFFDEQHHGKIYERMADGTTERPLDLSFTKTVAQIWIVVIVLIVVFLSCAKWYKKRFCGHDGDACDGNLRRCCESLYRRETFQALRSIPPYGVLLYLHHQPVRLASYLPRWCQRNRKHQHHVLPGFLLDGGHKPLRQQGVLEGYFLA